MPLGKWKSSTPQLKVVDVDRATCRSALRYFLSRIATTIASKDTDSILLIATYPMECSSHNQLPVPISIPIFVCNYFHCLLVGSYHATVGCSACACLHP